MKTKTIFAIVAAAFSLNAWAQTAKLTAEQILEKSIEATGGRAAYEAQKTQIITGEINLGAMGIKGSMKTYSKGNKVLVITEIPNLAKTRQGFDGKTAWQEDTMNGLRKLTGTERENLVRSATNATVNWKDFYKSVSLSGTEKVGDRDAYVVVMAPKVGEPIKSFYDTETFLVLRTLTTVKSPQGTFESDMSFSDYKDAGGVKMAHKMVMKVGPTEVDITITKVEVNTNIDDKIFDYPEVQKPATKPAPKTGSKASSKAKGKTKTK